MVALLTTTLLDGRRRGPGPYRSWTMGGAVRPITAFGECVRKGFHRDDEGRRASGPGEGRSGLPMWPIAPAGPDLGATFSLKPDAMALTVTAGGGPGQSGPVPTRSRP